MPDGFRIDFGPPDRRDELRSKTPEGAEYAGIMEWGTKVELRAEAEVELTPGEWRRFSRAMCAAFDVPYSIVVGRTWPRWWCWLCGHTPTETHDFAKDTWRCRCGTVAGFAGELRERKFSRWWLNLVGGRDRAWRHIWHRP